MISSNISEHCGVEILQCAHSNGCGFDLDVCYTATAKGKPKIIQWVLDKDRSWCKMVCLAAAKGGSLSILKRTRGKGCPWAPNRAASLPVRLISISCNGNVQEAVLGMPTLVPGLLRVDTSALFNGRTLTEVRGYV